MSALYRGGIVLLGVLSVLDLAAPLYSDGEHPPMFIALIGSALGLISIILAIFAWRDRAAAAVGLCVVRVLSAPTAVPAFWETGAPGPVMALAGSFTLLTVLGVVLTLAGLRRPVPVCMITALEQARPTHEVGQSESPDGVRRLGGALALLLAPWGCVIWFGSCLLLGCSVAYCS